MSNWIKKIYKLSVALILVAGHIAFTPSIVGANGEFGNIEPPNPGSVILDKTATDLGEGIYEITLSLHGIPVVKPTDIVLVMDISGSMTSARMNAAKSAATDFVNDIIGFNEGHRIAVVSFATNITVVHALSTNAGSLTTAINGLTTATGNAAGTHLEGGIKASKDLLDANANPTHNKAIIVLGDGEPTYGFEFNMGSYVGPVQTSYSFPNNCNVSVTNANRDNNANYTGNRYNFDYSGMVGSGNSMTFNKSFSISGSCSDWLGRTITGTGSFSRTFSLKDSVVWHANQAINAGYDVFSIGLLVGATGQDVLSAIQNKGYYDASIDNLEDIYEDIAAQISLAGTNAIVTDMIGDDFEFHSISPGYEGLDTAYNTATRILTWNVGNIGGTPTVLKYRVSVHDGLPTGIYPTNEWANLNYTNVHGQDAMKIFPVPVVDVITNPVVSLTVDPSGSGTVNGAGEHEHLAAVEISAVPLPGWVFVNWTDDDNANAQISTNSTYNFTMPDFNVNYTANFVESADITINYFANLGGSVNNSSEVLAPVTGTAVGSIATANIGFIFLNWTNSLGDVVGIDPEFIPDKVGGLNVAATYYANFIEAPDVTINYVAYTGGGVNPADETLAPATGIAAGSTATANPGYIFENWTDSLGVVVGTDAHFTPDKVGGLNVAATYYANFVEAPNVMINYVANFGGEVDTNNETLAPISGTAFGSTATANPGFTFLNWTDSLGVVVGTVAHFIPDKVDGLNVAATYYANFEENADVTISYFANIGGNVSIASETLAPATGTAGGSTATPISGYSFVNWTLDDVVVSTSSVFVPEKVDGLNVAATYYANFVENQNITINYNATLGGSVTRENESLAPVTGDALGSIAIAAPGFSFVNWTRDGIEVGVNEIFIPAKVGGLNIPTTYTANFVEQPSVTISYIANNGGSVSIPSETLAPFTDDAIGSTATANTGYVFENWTDSLGVVVGTDAHFIPDRVDGLNVVGTYYANFVAIDYTLTIIYEFEDGSEAAPVFTDTEMNVGDDYDIGSPSILGYTADFTSISGNMPADNVTRTVVYTAIDYTLTIIYEFEDGSEAAPTFTDTEMNVGQEFDVDSPVIPGYTADFASVTGTMPADDLTRTVVYTAIDYTLTIIYEFEDGSEAAPTFTDTEMNVGQEFEIDSPVIPGYTVSLETVSGTMPADDVRVLVVYNALDFTLTILYEFEDGTIANDPYVNGNMNVGDEYDVSSPTIIGYIPDFTSISGTMPAENTTRTVVYTAIDYTFTFDPNFEEETIVEQTFQVGGSVEGTSFTRVGFTFTGWTLDADGEIPYTGGLTNLPADDIYVYAQWSEDIVVYVLVFVTNLEGLSYDNVTFVAGESLVAPEPEVEGFVFLGWFVDEDYIDEFDEFDSMPARNVTVYADWGEVLGDEDEIPDTSDSTSPIGLLLFILGLALVITTREQKKGFKK